MPKRYRVVQWATGNVGSRALRNVIQHPYLDLAGVWVHSPDKVGRDAGTLCGIDPVGIAAVGTLEAVVALAPDCVLYMPHQANHDELTALLAAGINVVTTRTEFQNPARLDPALRARIEQACVQGNSSLHGTGSSPGFVTEALPIVLGSLQRRLDCLSISEFADVSSRNSPELLFQVMGFGSPPRAAADPGMLHHLRETFGGTLAVVADAMGVGFDSLEISGGLGFARHDVRIAAGLIPAGTVAATRAVITGVRDGKPLMRMLLNWYVSRDIETSDGEDWDLRESGWRLLVEGDCPLDVSITYPVAPEDYAEMTPGLTANRPVNAVAVVCEASPGIRTSADLPQVIARLA
ncbi:dihydrodipicolinate reductase [Sphingomonas ginsenosidivorax]|uniref:Dihydrodipicolinate reductase n=1 Tax=Sphingomonas ginsenosidivorax TaxID=862135 RepID=A0A5C6UNK8_9SPHN|nr:dihydrodipicolinate reductase [Sphingomonas ginsenosidivorax]